LRLLARVRVVATAVALCALVGTPAASAQVAGLSERTERRQAAEAELDAVVVEIEALLAERTDAEDARDRLVDELGELRAEAERAEGVLAERAVHTWTRRGAVTMEIVLASRGTGDALARARLLDGLGRRESRIVEEAETARASYRQRRAALAETVAEIAADETRLAELRGTLELAFADAQAAESELAGRRDRQRTVSRSGQEGVYACPIAPPFRFTDTWGAPRSGGRTHKGTDIFGEMGADVFAITSGEVLRHSSSRLGGIGLYLLGDDGHQYYYSHLQQIDPAYEPGRRVEAGERVAANGDTGNARGGTPHIHFEVRPGGGGNVNPYPYVAAACF
jgi:peptidoglycan LD-endopeptidase LytH